LLERLAGLAHQRIGYSQFGEDLHVRSFYDRLAHDRNISVKTGCIVDIGAFPTDRVFEQLLFLSATLAHHQHRPDARINAPIQ
jgi:hypothetical protein